MVGATAMCLELFGTGESLVLACLLIPLNEKAGFGAVFFAEFISS